MGDADGEREKICGRPGRVLRLEKRKVAGAELHPQGHLGLGGAPHDDTAPCWRPCEASHEAGLVSTSEGRLLFSLLSAQNWDVSLVSLNGNGLATYVLVQRE